MNNQLIEPFKDISFNKNWLNYALVGLWQIYRMGLPLGNNYEIKQTRLSLVVSNISVRVMTNILGLIFNSAYFTNYYVSVKK